MSDINFVNDGWTDYLYWQLNDPKMVKKINALLKSIERDGVLKGLGQPEKLKHIPDTYSRRIDKGNRLVYEIDGEKIIVTACKGHYEV